MSTRSDHAAALILVLVAAPAFAQAPEPSPASAAPAVRSSESAPAPDSRVLLDQIAGCVDSGKLSVEIDLQAGRVPAAPGWTVGVIGAPKATLVAEAVDGRVRRLDFAITDGRLLVDGKGLRPDVFVERIRFEEGKGITEARYRGRGIWTADRLDLSGSRQVGAALAPPPHRHPIGCAGRGPPLEDRG